MSHLTFSDRILALHYVFPVPLNRLSSLLQRDPNLERIGHTEASELAILLNISVDKAQKLQKKLFKNVGDPTPTSIQST